MRPSFLGLLGAVAAQYLQAFKYYDDDDGYYINPYGGVWYYIGDHSDVADEFSFQDGTIVGLLYNMRVRDDGRVIFSHFVYPEIVDDPVISVGVFYGIHGSGSTGLYPTNLDGRRFYVCKDYDSDNTYDVSSRHLYYINPEMYWKETSSSIDEGDTVIDSDTDMLNDTDMLSDTYALIEAGFTETDIHYVKTLAAKNSNEVESVGSLITEAPGKRAVHRERRAEYPHSFSPIDESDCEPVQLGLVPKDRVCTRSDDLGCVCVTQCVLASCSPGVLCPPRECSIKCRQDACYNVYISEACLRSSCKPIWLTSRCCETFYATEHGAAPRWAVLCPGNKCFDVCTPCTSLGCLALCTSWCPGADADRIVNITIPGVNITVPGVSTTESGESISGSGINSTDSISGRIFITERVTSTSCYGTTCPWVSVITGCRTCAHTLTDYVLTCWSGTTITISTCIGKKCSPKTLKFLSGTHTILGTAVVPHRDDILVTIDPVTFGATEAGSTTAGNNASRSTLVGTFVGALLFGLLMW